jgi:hypothetical protein
LFGAADDKILGLIRGEGASTQPQSLEVGTLAATSISRPVPKIPSILEAPRSIIQSLLSISVIITRPSKS